MKQTILGLALLLSSYGFAQGAPIVARITIPTGSAITSGTLVTAGQDTFYRVSGYFATAHLDSTGSVWCLKFTNQDSSGVHSRLIKISSTVGQTTGTTAKVPQTASTVIGLHSISGSVLTYAVTTCWTPPTTGYELYLTVEQLTP